MSSPQPSVTAFALLALLSLRDRWTTYELTKEMRRNVVFFWPRAESKLYEQAKRLVELGLADASRERTGERPRTIYRITPSGRAALRDWLGEQPARGVALHSEALVRVLASGQAGVDELQAVADTVEAEALGMFAVAAAVAREYRAARHPFQTEVHVRAFIFDFLSSHAAANLEWARRTRATLATWPGATKQQRRARGLALIEESIKRWPPGTLDG
jgi:PadR family transcriptional regulator, regulatory protein AphA